MRRILASLVALIVYIVAGAEGQLICTLPEVPGDITQEIGTCDALLLKLLATNYIPKAETGSLCSIFRNKIQKLDSPLNDLNCSVFGSILIQCDLKSAITSSEILRQYFMRHTKPSMRELYYLTTILSNLPPEIGTVLGRDDIVEDSNEIINDKLGLIKKQISNHQPLDISEISFLFGSISQLVRLGSRNPQHLKALNSILDSRDAGLSFHPVVDLDTFLLNFSLLSKAYFFLKAPTDFDDIPLSLQQMAYSVSRIKIREVKNLAVLNEYIVTRKLFMDSGVYLIQGYQNLHPDRSHEEVATILFCRPDGSPFENLALDLAKSDAFKLEGIPNTCEYRLLRNRQDPDQDQGGPVSQIPKLRISSRFIPAREARVPILDKPGPSFAIVKARIFLGDKLALGRSEIKDLESQQSRLLDGFQISVELQTDLETLNIETIYRHFTAFEIKALSPRKTVGTRSIKLVPAVVEGNRLKLYLDLTSDEFICSSSEFSLRLVVGSSSTSKAFNTEIASIRSLGDSNDASSLKKLCPNKIHPKLEGFYPKEEIAYTFKEPRKLPGPLLPYCFSILIFSSLGLIFPIWNKLSNVDQGISTFKNVPLVKMATFGSLAISLLIILCYWHSLNIFQFAYAFTPAVCIFLVLLKISLRNFKYPEPSQEKPKSD
ncbi:hypothetical protein OJ252_680 [Cryptosporidium canis]|uniref:Ribophorin-2 n=1 Tax=Cryptosporidium canis TaxID=195482 RepID=A0ABQ8PA89_9CRYT|nr:hypothetical protein OJ252_680 [Cryptosporidium canis]